MLSLSTVVLGWDLKYASFPLVRTYHIHVKKSCCVKDVNENLMDYSTFPRFSLRTMKTNPYLYLPADDKLLNFLKTTYNPVTLPPSDTPMEASSRLTSLLAFEIITMLNIPTWDQPGSLLPNRGLVINWVLIIPLLELMEHVAFLMCVYFLPMIQQDYPHKFLLRVQERVIKSPLREWSQLSSLVFSPNLSHELTSPPYKSVISGNPCLSAESLAWNLRNLFSTILSHWSSDPETLFRLSNIRVLGPPACGTCFHPANQLLALRFLTEKESHNIFSLRRTISNLLRLEEISITTFPLSQYAWDYIRKAQV